MDFYVVLQAAARDRDDIRLMPPITRSDIRQTSFERKMRGYLTAHAAGQHELHFGATTPLAPEIEGGSDQAMGDRWP
jgi:hypothetical protein